MRGSRVPAVVVLVHVLALVLWNVAARAGEPATPKAPATPCACVDCDLDHNGRATTYFDWRVLYTSFGKPTTDPAYSPRADFNRNGSVDGQDWATMASCCGAPTAGQ